MVDYEVIELVEDIFDAKMNLDLEGLNNDVDNLYIVGYKTFTDILSIDTFPIKNKRIARKQILNFLKYVDGKLHSIDSSDGIISITQKEIIKNFNRDSYVGFMKLLSELKIISSIPQKNGSSYDFKNNISKRYRFFKNYDNQENCIVIIKDKIDIEINIDGKFDKKFVKTISNIEIDIKGAVLAEIQNKSSIASLRKRLNTIFSLYNRRYIKKGTNVDRVFHSLSNISKVSRPFLFIKDMKFNNIDIINCQPLLLCYYLIKNNLNIDKKYIADCQIGLLYEKFLLPNHTYIDIEYIKKDGKITSTKKHVITLPEDVLTNDKVKNEYRAKIKVLLYKSIYFNFNDKTDIAIMFKSLYPETFSSLEYCSQDELKMAGRLQNIEAELFNNLIPTISKYYFTLFDAIFFTSIEDAGEIIMKLTLEFHKMGLVPQFKLNE